jgi:hypothetical protein
MCCIQYLEAHSFRDLVDRLIMNFTIEQLDRNSDGGVTQVHWIVSKTSGNYTATNYGSCEFMPDTTSDGYVEFESLTQDNVISWLQSKLDTADIESHLDADLAEQATPSTITGLPDNWSTT